MRKRRTDPEILIDHLKESPGRQASQAAIGQALGWDRSKVNRAIDRAITEGRHLHRAQGGTVKYRESERGSSNGLYDDIMRVARDHWAPKLLKLKRIDIFDTSRSGQRGSGVWSHPDLVMAADPSRRSSPDDPRRLHAIEVETAQGFDLKSIYQAHAQGRGADFSWVIGQHFPDEGQEHWDRVMWTAAELNVGLVTFRKPSVFSTWKLWNKPEKRNVSRAERERFLSVAVGPHQRMTYEL